MRAVCYLCVDCVINVLGCGLEPLLFPAALVLGFVCLFWVSFLTKNSLSFQG